jgi:hypothetical protein
LSKAPAAYRSRYQDKIVSRYVPDKLSGVLEKGPCGVFVRCYCFFFRVRVRVREINDIKLKEKGRID